MSRAVVKSMFLRHKLMNSTIGGYVEVEARIEGETERRLIEIYKLYQGRIKEPHRILLLT